MTTKVPFKENMFVSENTLSRVWLKFFNTLTSINNIVDALSGTSDQVTITDNGDGTVTFSLPQDIDTDADVEFASAQLDDLTASRLVASNASKVLVSVANLASWIAGTASQITITDDGDGTITLSLPQDIATSSSPVFATIKLSSLTDGYLPYHVSDAAGLDDSVIFTDGTNIGIGTVDPDVLLHVKKVNATAVIRLERDQTTITTDDILGRIEVETKDSTDPGVCAKIEAISRGSSGETGWRILCGTPSALTEVMRIDEYGYVGIGGANPTIEPDALLHLEDVTGAIQRFTRQTTNPTADAVIGRLEFETKDSDSAGIAAVIQALAEGSSGEVGLAFETGTGGSPIERLRIANDGTVTAGDSSNYASIAPDGVLTFAGTGRVYQNEWISAGGFNVPGTKPAVKVDWGISYGWEFTDGTDDTVYATRRLPLAMDKTVAPEFKIGWASATNDPGDDSKRVVWQLEYLYLTANESTVAAAQETLSVTTTVSTTANGLTVSTITGMDLPAAGDQFVQVRIKRLGADAADTLGDDCVLLGAGLKYAADKLGTAL